MPPPLLAEAGPRAGYVSGLNCVRDCWWQVPRYSRAIVPDRPTRHLGQPGTPHLFTSTPWTLCRVCPAPTSVPARSLHPFTPSIPLTVVLSPWSWAQLHPLKIHTLRGAWVVQSVEQPTLAHVVISRFVDSSPASGSLLSAQSPLQILCAPISLPLPHSCPLSLSKINKM